MKLLEVIDKFNKAQRYVKNKLFIEYGIATNIKARDWATMYTQIRELHEQKPIGTIFYPHGYGLEFQDAEVHVDFDFCESGQEDGFDAWRLYIFSKDNHLETSLQDHQAFIDALKALKVASIVEQDENLYFLTKPRNDKST